MRVAKVAGVAVMAASAAAGLWALNAPQPKVEQRAELLCTSGYVLTQPLPGPSCSGPCQGISTGPTGVTPFFDTYACSNDL